ncbi:unnamed protein product [Phytophthora fragariaefolia]|uniref:Unnamed protein product n=1 Tax=Phytophthora fragariaefolia TaxID=1490495 RepID=A0A9W6XT77_9STRA|nr:unnamed protein product [Phytophthora fragariaefolia]
MSKFKAVGATLCTQPGAISARKHEEEEERHRQAVDEKDFQTKTEKELVRLELLKKRVTVHKDREELKEKKYRLELARQKQAEGHSATEGTNKQHFSDATVKEAVDELEFEGLDAIKVADDNVPVDSAEDIKASEVLDSTRNTVKSLIELPDGMKIPLADYLRMDHNKQSKKLCALGPIDWFSG